MSVQLPVGWTWVTPADVASDAPYALAIGPFGSNLKVSDYTNAGIPLVFVRHIRAERFDGDDSPCVSLTKAKELAAHWVHSGDVLVTKMGEPPGDSALYPAHRKGAVITADCLKWSVDSRVGNSKFFMYILRTPAIRQHLQSITQGVAQRKISLGRFKTVQFPCPPVREQGRIVEALDSHLSRLDAAVEGLEAAQRKLKAYRASVLKAAVEGRLVATEADLAKREGRSYESADVLLQRILRERRRCWEEAELAKMSAAGKTSRDDRWRTRYQEPALPDPDMLPRLPEGWRWTTLDAVSDVKGGITKGQKRRPGEALCEVPYLRVANVQRGYLDLRLVKTIKATPSEVDELRLLAGDVLFNEGGDRDKLGRGWVWNGEIRDCIHQNHVFRARLFGPLKPQFVSWYANSNGQAYFFDQGKQTTNLASVNMTKLKALPIPVPPLAEQDRILEELERLLSVADATANYVGAEVRRCQRLRQSILSMAFDGRLVAQDSTDEPAHVMLARIRAERSAAVPATRKRRRARKLKAAS
jgi:type I restriction enzyme, S subunit